MTVSDQARNAALWLVLVAATVISFTSSRTAGRGAEAVLLVIVMLMYAKSRLALFGFMEVGKGLASWRILFEAWLVAAAGEICWFLR